MYVVDGFEFQTKEEARQAKKESDGIRYIKDQTDMSDPGYGIQAVFKA